MLFNNDDASYFKTDKVTDLAYWMTFAWLISWLFFMYWSTSAHALLFALIVVRWVRLACYLFMRILVIKKDKRFDWIRENKKSFWKFRLLQWVAIFILLLPVLVIFTKEWLVTHWISILWWIIWIIWICIESIADWQKFIYKRQNPEHWVDVWLWSKAKHPNYFGEMLFWRWIYLVCVPYLSWLGYATVASPFMITWLLLFVTWIPPLKEQWERWERKYGDIAEFKEWKENTKLLFPW